MPVKDIITIIIALRALAWFFFESIHLQFCEQRESLSRPVLQECLDGALGNRAHGLIWTPDQNRNNEGDAVGILEKFLADLKSRGMSFIPDLELTNQIWLVRGAINSAFAMTFVFLIYGICIPFICSADVCISFPLQLSAGEALRYTALVIGLITFAYALQFTARLQLRQAIMNMILWNQWKSRIFKKPPERNG